MYFLAIHEVPCIGTLPLVIEADTYEKAYDIAFDQSCKPHHVMGGFDLYHITYDHAKHSHTLRDVTRELDYEISAYPHDDFEDEILAPVHCNWCEWSGDEADLDMNEYDEPAFCPVCGRSDCIADS